MRRHELEHLIRAAAAVTNEYEIVVIGSQSILGAVADPPAALLQSMEADCYPLKQPELADLIDGAIGELSPFHERFGYYADGQRTDLARTRRHNRRSSRSSTAAHTGRYEYHIGTL